MFCALGLAKPRAVLAYMSCSSIRYNQPIPIPLHIDQTKVRLLASQTGSIFGRLPDQIQ